MHRQNIEMQTHYFGFKNQVYELNISTGNIREIIRPDEQKQVENYATDQAGKAVKFNLSDHFKTRSTTGKLHLDYQINPAGIY